MSKTFFLINVFICQINTAGKSCFAINDTDFTVIPVVLHNIQKRTERIKDLTLNAFFAKILIIFVWQCCNTAKAIIDQAYIHAFRSLLFQNIQDGVPHDTIVDDKIFNINIVLSTFQLFYQYRKHIIPYLKILGGSITMCGETRILADIIGLDCCGRIFFCDLMINLRILFHIGKAFFLDFCIMLLNFLGYTGFSEKNI